MRLVIFAVLCLFVTNQVRSQDRIVVFITDEGLDNSDSGFTNKNDLFSRFKTKE